MAADSRFDGPGPDQQYASALNQGRLCLQHCEACQALRFPPALVCRACGSPRLAWRESPGRGTIYATTTVRDRAGAYNVCLVELEGGARMMSRVEGIEPDTVRIGQAVRARIVPGDEPYVLFEPAEVQA
ncbi:Zn-ribbon domain-containing OB-fold protein [Bordetella petrii]|uniref:Zn-ribbon domain-containing OB-fold protein n=1 Tax=Bordetella petrii TaxID=94624 RepID=UPI001E2EF4AD|nr:OB-fold domain-containing protein [Bordetella petrii]MCD0504942.1 OB-fold domain-containing protein [Bordetella petrii]